MSVCDVPIISTVCDVAGEAAATVVAAPFDWLAQAMGGAAGWLIEAMWAVFDTTTLVDVTADGFTAVYNLIFGIGVFLVLIFFCLQLITGLIKRDPTALSRAALGAAKSVLGAFVVVTLTALALEIVDQLCIGIIQASGETTETMGDKIILLAAGLSAINIAAPGVGAIVTIFLAGLMIAAVFIVWFSLLIRKALLLVAVVLAPIAFAGASWDATKGWIGKWAAFVIALIVSKLVLVVIFLLAITQIATPDRGGHRRRHRADHRHRPDGYRGFRPVYGLPLRVVHRLRPVPADGHRAGGQERAQPPPAGAVQAPGRQRAEEGAR